MANDTTDSTLSSPSDTVDEFPGYPGLKLGDPIPGQPGTNIGDPIIDDAGNRWNWRKGEWEYVNLAQPPSRDKGGIKPGDETSAPDYYNPASQQSTFVPGTSPSVTKREDQAIVTSGGSTLIQAPSRTPVVPLPPLPQEPIQDLARPPIVPQKSNVSILPKYTQPALVEPTTVPIPARRADVLGSPYNGYINYDPEEIMAAAMRSLGGRMARRSMLNELR